jgi:predicted amidohydrolase
MRTAAINWKIRPLISLLDFFNHIDEVLRLAGDAQLIVLPEFFSLELLQILPDQDSVVQQFIPIVEHLQRASVNSGATIIGGSHLARVGPTLQNLCPIITPGDIILQPKLKMTVFEKDDMGCRPGTGLKRPVKGISSLICYDAEFPEAVRLLAEEGLTALAVPAFTETLRGFQRVRWSCLARAIENQTFVIHSSLVGSIGKEPIPNAVGTSAIIAPCLEPFPESAILAETAMNEQGAAVADLDFEALAVAKTSNDVRNWEDRDPSCWKFADSRS